ncbi:hypothetical protein WA556_004627, partial [Blastocystis sp. ATCC 50177/Nand II]
MELPRVGSRNQLAVQEIRSFTSEQQKFLKRINWTEKEVNDVIMYLRCLEKYIVTMSVLKYYDLFKENGVNGIDVQNLKACCSRFSTILSGHFLRNLDDLKDTVYGGQPDMIGKARKIATLEGEDFLGFLQLLLMNQTMNGVGAKFTSLCNLLLGYRSRRDVSFDALEMMQSSSQRLYSAAREERFAAIVSATDEGMIECVVN